MDRLFRSLETAWVAAVGHMTRATAEQVIGRYFTRYNWVSPIGTMASCRWL